MRAFLIALTFLFSASGFAQDDAGFATFKKYYCEENAPNGESIPDAVKELCVKATSFTGVDDAVRVHFTKCKTKTPGIQGLDPARELAKCKLEIRYIMAATQAFTLGFQENKCEVKNTAVPAAPAPARDEATENNSSMDAS